LTDATVVLLREIVNAQKMMLRNIDAQRRVRDDFSLEITGDGERSKSAKENQQRRRILHLISVSNARITSEV
jgi:hypothetical protein